jgi:hypothetical protein
MVKKEKKIKSAHIPIWEEKHEITKIASFRKEWLEKGYDLIDITQLVELKLGRSGCCNNFNEPNEEIYHIQVHYRDECIANFKANSCYPIDDDKYVIFTAGCSREDDDDFIIFRKCPVKK